MCADLLIELLALGERLPPLLGQQRTRVQALEHGLQLVHVPLLLRVQHLRIEHARFRPVVYNAHECDDEGRRWR
jgi:hypothetical protein